MEWVEISGFGWLMLMALLVVLTKLIASGFGAGTHIEQRAQVRRSTSS